MKKVLILTTSTGQGHNQAANSLIEAFNESGYTCVKRDFLEKTNKLLNKIIVLGYEILASKIPNIYGWFYKLTDSKAINKLDYIFFLKTTRKMLKIINEENPDVIIGTHPFTVNIISHLKRKGMTIPFISIVTDFKAHYSYVNSSVDSYITGSEFTKDSLVKRGINANIIYPVGIPIKESFFEKDINIPYVKNDDYYNLLLMSGSMGLNNISYVLDELLKNSHKLRITVVCGNNEHLKKTLDEKAKLNFPNKKLHIIGFSNDIASFMEYSDILISKPGGLTVTEAIAKNLPLIIPFVIPGQEMENTEFLTSNGYAYYVKHYSDINSTVNKLIENPEELQRMREKLKVLAASYSLKSIINVADKLIDKK